MTIIYPEKNYSDNFQPQGPDSLLYDLEEEKKEIATATEEVKKELWEKWKKNYADADIFPPRLAKINPELVEFMLSFERTLFYNKVAQYFELTQKQRDALAQAVWSTVINRQWTNISGAIADNLGVDFQKAKKISDLVFANILNQAMMLSEKPFVPRKNLVVEAEKKGGNIKMTILQVLKQYPGIGEQLVTNSRIKAKIFTDPVRPSVKNWINDYYENIGAGKHGSVERGNYLFHSENAKRLTFGERQKLGMVLKSLDEEVPLVISQENQEIIFATGGEYEEDNNDRAESKTQNIGYEQKINPNSQSPQNISDTKFSFSSPHKFPAERQKISDNIPARSGGYSTNSQNVNPKIKGNIIDLRSN